MSLAKPSYSFSVRLCLVVFASFSLSLGQQGQDEESNMTAPRTGAISGRVVNESGQSISHATIFVNAQRGFGPPRTTVTDEGGNFEVTDLEALLYIVNATAPSYVTVPREPDALPPYSRIGDSVTIRMIKGGVITGTLTSPTGEPVVQVGVRALLIRDANGKPPSGVRFPTERATDDRGVYRLYGLPAGTYLVSTGGRGTFGSITNPFETDASTYAPSSTRDGAAEIVVNAGEETSGVDIRHRGEQGYVISGIVSGPSESNSANLQLSQMANGRLQMSAYSYLSPNNNGFAFYGIGDGEYYLLAQSFVGPGEGTVSEPRRVTVKGADVTGIELVVRGLASVKGHLTLESTSAVECKNKRRPLLSETLLLARRSDKDTTTDQLALQGYKSAQGTPDKSGDFSLRNLGPGRFSLYARFHAKYWYLRSMTRENATPQPVRGKANPQIDIAREGLALKFGERVEGFRVTLAEGAASLRGALKLAQGERVPTRLYLHLVPAEKEKADDVLRFFTSPVNADGSFALNNLPPGRYWALARVAAENEPQSDVKLRTPDEVAMRTRLRLAAESLKTAIEFKPCQNVIDYQLPFKSSSVNN